MKEKVVILACGTGHPYVTTDTALASHGKNLDVDVILFAKNIDGVYETDFIDVTLWTNVAENTCDYCKVGDMIGIKGRLQVRRDKDSGGKEYNKLELVGEKVTFLASMNRDKEVSKEKEVKQEGKEK